MEEQSRWDQVLGTLRTSLWGVGIILTVLGARSLGAFNALELMVLDRFLAFSTQLSIEMPDENITIVQIDPPYLEGSAEKGYTIPADSLASILETIFASKPTVIGTDIASHRITGDNQSKILSVIDQHPNLIIGLSNEAEPLLKLSDSQRTNQVGFNDLFLDQDGIVRRARLGFSPTGKSNDYQLSFAVQVIKEHFKNANSTSGAIELENGEEDLETMRFGTVEIPRVKNTYGYTDKQLNGVQTLINYRGNSEPFRVTDASKILESETIRNELIKDNIVILSLASSSREFVIPLTRIFDSNLNDSKLGSKLGSGIEIQAHIISQIVQAVEDSRPLIWTNKTVQYTFFIVVSFLGIGCSRFSKNILNSFLALLVIIITSIVVSYLVLLQMGILFPLAVTLVSTTANGLIYINYSQNKQRWEKLIAQRDIALEKERQLSEALASQRKKTIENVFDSIHNGPLQTLANLLRRTRDETIGLPDICLSLEDLNREIRYIGDSIRQDASDEKHSLDVSYAGTKFDLDIPLQELFQEVYDAMLSRPLMGFSSLKFTIISFDPIESEKISIEVKRKLCRFLEEALGNVGKHAVGATRLVVTGKHKDNSYELTIADNGPGFKPDEVETGEGTRIGDEVSKLTRGNFIHKPNKPKGFFCQLTFPIPT